MLVLIKTLRWIYNTFAGAMSPTQIAYGMCLGLFLVTIPFSLSKAHIVAILFLVLTTRASIGVFMLTMALVKPLMLIGGHELAWHVGWKVLENPSLKPTLKKLLN